MTPRRILHSWKEIAQYTGRGVRTVQWYETQIGLPVHRPAGKGRSAVLAFSDEIDAWLSKAPTRADADRVLPSKEIEQLAETKGCFLAMAANAKRSYESAQAAFESCLRQTQRVEACLRERG